MPTTPPSILRLLEHLLRGEPIDAAAAEGFIIEVLAGHVEPAPIGAVLALIQRRGPTEQEILGAARAMRRAAALIPPDPLRRGTLIDTCGTGGARKTFNVSTLAAIVTAAAAPGRVCVAKHGNKGRSGRGSAEVMAALGVNTDAPAPVQSRCLREIGLCFCFAPHHHPAMRHAAAARAALGFPTLFNVLGPLANPAGAQHQLMGVYNANLVEPVARALQALGTQRAMVVHALDGIDEISTCGPTQIAHTSPDGVRLEELDPAILGLPRATPSELDARDLDHAVHIAREVLAGAAGPARDIVALNAAGALLVAGAAADWQDGLTLARAALDSGAAATTLASLVRLSHEPA